jgi:hypothetical protein
VKTTVCKNDSSSENINTFFFWADLGSGLSPNICPNQHFLWLTNMRYVLFKGRFSHVPCTFLRIFYVLLKVREPVQARYNIILQLLDAPNDFACGIK